MNNLIIKFFLTLCFFFCWYSPSTSESQKNDISTFDSDIPEKSKDERLMDTLKELFFIKDAKRLNLKNLTVLDNDLLYKLIEDDELKNLSGINSISSCWMGEKSNRSAKTIMFIFQVWKFDSKDDANRYYDVMIRAVGSDSRYEKPAKLFFLVSDELYYFTGFIWGDFGYMIGIQNKIINFYFPNQTIICSRCMK
jgi:hypothetical protein